MDANVTVFSPRYVKLFAVAPGGSLLVLEEMINQWVNESNSLILGLEITVSKQDQMLAAVLFVKAEKFGSKHSEPATQLRAAETTVPTGNRPPTMDMIKKEGEKRTRIQLMAGAFPAEEGGKLHPNDQELAPRPLLADTVDLRKYGALFGNTGGEDARPASTTSPTSSGASAGSAKQ